MIPYRDAKTGTLLKVIKQFQTLSSPNLLRRRNVICSRGFRSQKGTSKFAPTPVEQIPGECPSSANSLLKPLFFTVGFSATTYVGCTIWQYENFRKRTQIPPFSGLYDSWFPQYKKYGGWRQQVNEFWNDLSDGQKIFAPVLLANVLVFLAWRVPKWQPVMLKYFASNPAAKAVCWPMFLSTFSHYSAFHLAANMYVLHSFSTLIVNALGKEQTAALYLSGGVIASFTSLFHKFIISQPALSIGASGAIMAILGFVCTKYPDIKLSIILIPAFTFSAGAAIKFVVGLDFLGVMLGWKFFDHAAHLGGAISGICWALWGNELWQKREAIVVQWHKLRGEKR